MAYKPFNGKKKRMESHSPISNAQLVFPKGPDSGAFGFGRPRNSHQLPRLSRVGSRSVDGGDPFKTTDTQTWTFHCYINFCSFPPKKPPD